MAKAVVYTVNQNLPLVRLNEWLNYIWPETQTPTGNIKPSWVEFDYCSVMCVVLCCVCVCCIGLLFWMTDNSLKKKHKNNQQNKEYLFIYSWCFTFKNDVLCVCFMCVCISLGMFRMPYFHVSHSISAVCSTVLMEYPDDLVQLPKRAVPQIILREILYPTIQHT